jgi:hypothetical protein
MSVPSIGVSEEDIRNIPESGISECYGIFLNAKRRILLMNEGDGWVLPGFQYLTESKYDGIVDKFRDQHGVDLLVSLFSSRIIGFVKTPADTTDATYVTYHMVFCERNGTGDGVKSGTVYRYFSWSELVRLPIYLASRIGIILLKI